MDNPVQGEYVALPKRHLSEETCRMFGYQVGEYNGKPCQIANVYDKDRTLVGQKIRLPGKDFRAVGDVSGRLIGAHLWTGGRKIVITEGEIDMMSVSQLQGNKYPVVSLPNGADSAKKAIKQNMEYLRQFEEVILMFDMDEPGRKAVEDCIRLFRPGHVLIAELPLKDAGECLVEGKGQEVIKAIWNAHKHKPAGISTGIEILNSPEADSDVVFGIDTPFPTLTAAIYGSRLNEMTCWLSGTGCGKTDMLKQWAAQYITAGMKCGMILLEEPNRLFTINSVASKMAKQFLHIPGMAVNESVKAEYQVKAAEGLVIYKVDGGVEPEDIEDIIRYMVVGEGCNVVFFDHVTYILDTQQDGLAAAKSLMNTMNALNKELPFHLHYVAHLRKGLGKETHEEGARIHLDDAAGGKALTQYADYVFGLERNNQDSEQKNYTTLRVLKGGRVGVSCTGLTIDLLYDETNGTKVETSRAFEPEGSSGDKYEF